MADWLSLEGSLSSNSAAASWGEFEVQVFAIQDGQLLNRYWDGEAWHKWESLGGDFTGQPAASARDADRIDVFAVGADGTLRHRYWNGKEWVAWSGVEGAPNDAKGVTCSWVGDRLNLFVWGADDQLWHNSLQ